MKQLPIFTFRLIQAAAVLLLCQSFVFADAGNEQYEYDALGRLKKVTYPSGQFINYSFDAAGNRTVVSNLTPAALGTFSVTGGGRGANGSVALSFVKNIGLGTITGITASCQNSGFNSSSGVTSTTLAPNATLTVTSYDGGRSGFTYCRVRLTGINASNSPFLSSVY